jgi:hypothetical protein
VIQRNAADVPKMFTEREKQALATSYFVKKLVGHDTGSPLGNRQKDNEQTLDNSEAMRAIMTTVPGDSDRVCPFGFPPQWDRFALFFHRQRALMRWSVISGCRPILADGGELV